MRRASLLTLMLLLSSGPAGGTTYYFSTSGSNGNSGTEASPYRDLNQVPGLLTPGTTVLLKRGDVWYVDSLVWNFSNKDGSQGAMVLGAYGTGARPVVAVLDTSTWLKGPTNTFRGRPQWYRTAADSVDEVIRFYLFGTPLARVANKDSLMDSTYAVLRDSIFAKCSGCSSATTFEYMRDRSGYDVYAENTSNFTIRDIEVRGGSAWTAIMFQAPTGQVTLDNIYLHQFSNYGVRFQTDGTTSSAKHVDLSVLNCAIDKGWSPHMNHERPYAVMSPWGANTLTFGANDGQPGGDGILVSDAIDGATVRGCYVTNMGHTGIGMELVNAANLGIRRLLIEQNTVLLPCGCCEW